MKSLRPVRTATILLFSCLAAYAQDTGAGSADNAALLVRAASGPYRMLEKSDWARYDSGKYVGHVYREVRATISPSGPGNSAHYRGDFLVLEETLRDLSRSARSVDSVVPAAFRVAEDGRIDVIEDRGFPSLRGFPSFPAKPVAVGQRWTARGIRAVDPRNEGAWVKVPLIAEYEYRGIEPYKGIPVHRIFAKYATRYASPKSTASAPASPAFVSASGTHEADILIRAEDGLPLLIRDRMDETFTWQDGSTTRFKGFTLTFSEGISLLDRSAVVADLRGAIGGRPVERSAPGGSASDESAGASAAIAEASPTKAPREGPGIGAPAAAARAKSPPSEEPPSRGVRGSADPASEANRPQPIRAGPEAIDSTGEFDLAGDASGIAVEAVDTGVRLTVRDVHFAPDSDQILPSEKARLDLIAQALKRVGDRTILVEGHTAAVGKAAGELELSTRRAKRMADELAVRGIDAGRFLYKGWGGDRPIAPNDTETGRAKNRRVEITILD